MADNRKLEPVPRTTRGVYQRQRLRAHVGLLVSHTF